MSEIEKFEADYRLLATRLIYALINGESDPSDQEKLDRLGEELARLNAADFTRFGSIEETEAA